MINPAGWIERHAAFSPDKPAIVDEHQDLTYAALAQRVAQLSHWLSETCALPAGARVAWLGHNSADMLAMLFACAHTQRVLVPLNWRLSAPELQAVLDDAGVSVLIVDASCAASWGRLHAPHCVRTGHWPAGQSDNERHANSTLPVVGDAAFILLPPDQEQAESPLLLVYTSGTTGRPKGVVLSQRAVLFNALNAIHMHDMRSDDRVLTVLPMFHVGGLNIQTLPALYCGASVRLLARFEPAATLAQISAWRPTLTTLVPATISALFESPQWGQQDLSCLRAIATGSTDVPRSLIDAVHQHDVAVIQVYGATETGPVAVYQRINDARSRVGSIGRPGLHSEVRLVDEQGDLVRQGKPGEIQVRGPHVSSGYWDSTRAAPVPFDDGWFVSGDVASCDDAGWLWFNDRIKHVIISGGENIYPAELERILNASSLLLEAAVVGRADVRWGQVPVVVAVAADPACDETSVLALFDGQLAHYKRPHGVIFVEQLPRTALGKVAVQQLREQVAALA